MQRIPNEFIARFGNELKNVATITVPDGCIWEMELKKCGNDVFFCNKWQEFIEYYSIGYGWYLSFNYEGNSKFSVTIIDVTSVEICYPFKTLSTSGEPKTKYPSPRKRSKVKMSTRASKKAEKAANEFNPINPFFRSKIAKANRTVRIILWSFWFKVNVGLFMLPLKLISLSFCRVLLLNLLKST
jgi:hypothetical protein